MDNNQPPTSTCQQTLYQNAKVSLPVTIKSYANTGDIHVNCWSDSDPSEMCGACCPTVTLYITIRVPIHTGAIIEVGEPILHG